MSNKKTVFILVILALILFTVWWLSPAFAWEQCEYDCYTPSPSPSVEPTPSPSPSPTPCFVFDIYDWFEPVPCASPSPSPSQEPSPSPSIQPSPSNGGGCCSNPGPGGTSGSDGKPTYDPNRSDRGGVDPKVVVPKAAPATGRG